MEDTLHRANNRIIGKPTAVRTKLTSQECLGLNLAPLGHRATTNSRAATTPIVVSSQEGIITVKRLFMAGSSNSETT
jgi:hypothetical protein